MTDQQDRLKVIYDEIEAGVEQLKTSDDWLAMLSVAARFPRYSFGNIVLLWRQMPDATMVMGYGNRQGTTGWKSLGRHVRAGERSLKVLGPVKRWVTEVDETTGQERRVKKVVAFTPVSVWDISQTDGKPLPDVAPKLLAGDAPKHLWDAVVRQLDDLGWSVRLEAPGGSANGTSDPKTKTVRVRPDVEPLQALKTCLHEKHHVALGHTEDMAEYLRHRNQMETEAESASYLVMKALGLDSSSYSIPYIAHWQSDSKMLREVAERVLGAAHETLAGIEALAVELPAVEAAQDLAVSL